MHDIKHHSHDPYYIRDTCHRISAKVNYHIIRIIIKQLNKDILDNQIFAKNISLYCAICSCLSN